MPGEQWTDLEMILTLGFYKFENNPDDKKKIKKFTEKMNIISGVNRKPNSVDFRIGNYKYVDPDYTGKGLNGGGSRVVDFYNKYVIEEPSLKTLANIYSNFLKFLLHQIFFYQHHQSIIIKELF